ncbi:MAG: hypothetical protein IJV75_03105, partial [Alphaproteobacteria bacterium]|nr:hypothetical protein [Alphaproteobacteria bacterium]
MDINIFNIYSAISGFKNFSEDKTIKTLEKIEMLEKITSYEDAIKYLKDTWDIETDVANYFLCKDCFLNLEDTEDLCTISFEYKNKNIICYYNK